MATNAPAAVGVLVIHNKIRPKRGVLPPEASPHTISRNPALPVPARTRQRTRLAGHLHRRRARGGRLELLSMGRGRLRARRLRARGSRPTVRARDAAAGSRAPPSRVCDDRGHRCRRRGAGLLSEGDLLIARSCVSRNERTRDLRARSSRLQFSELKCKDQPRCEEYFNPAPTTASRQLDS